MVLKKKDHSTIIQLNTFWNIMQLNASVIQSIWRGSLRGEATIEHLMKSVMDKIPTLQDSIWPVTRTLSFYPSGSLAVHSKWLQILIHWPERFYFTIVAVEKLIKYYYAPWQCAKPHWRNPYSIGGWGQIKKNQFIIYQ